VVRYGDCVLQAVYEVTLKTRERLSVRQLITTHNATTVTISPLTTRYAQVFITVHNAVISAVLCRDVNVNDKFQNPRVISRI